MGKAVPACPVCEEAAARFFGDVDGLEYWRCERCIATFLSPAQRLDRLGEKREYDRHRNAVDDPGYRGFLARLADPLLQRLTPGAEGLDYGCGPGPALAAMLTEAGHRIRLWDPIYHPDDAALGLQYDFISCTEVVEHMHHPAREFKRIHTLLRPGGILALMTTFQTDDARFANWHYRRDPTHVVFYREATMHYIARHLNLDCEIPATDIAFMRKPESNSRKA